MKEQLFSVFDHAAQRFLSPFYSPTIEYAIRQFRATVNTLDHQFNKFPEDYTLFHLGEFNQELGVIKALASPAPLGVAITMLESNQRPEAVVEKNIFEEV